MSINFMEPNGQHTWMQSGLQKNPYRNI